MNVKNTFGIKICNINFINNIFILFNIKMVLLKNNIPFVENIEILLMLQ